ncbi:MAG: hypothetical protein M0P11_04075 [Anaerolineaceae bacterium]|nr:hypothetical protein [Anaerolineaceae bacterium]
MDEQRFTIKQAGFWNYGLRYILMWTLAIVAVLGFSRFLNTLLERGIIFELDFPTWLPTYLIITGFIQLVLGMAAYIAFKEERSWHVPALWITALLTIASIWVERLVLWVPDQRARNHTFTLVLHLIWLLLIIFYTVTERKKEPLDGPGD